MILLAKIGVGLLSTAVAGTALVCSEGFLSVKVHEKQADGTRFSIVLPAALIPATLAFVPARHFNHAGEQLRAYLPVIDAALPTLEKCPDGVLVEVIDPGEHVRVAKEYGSIVVDVDDPGEVVHVAVPLRAALSSIHEIAEK